MFGKRKVTLYISLGIFFFGYLLLINGIGGQNISSFWLLIAGLISTYLFYGNPFYLFKRMTLKNIPMILAYVVITIVGVTILSNLLHLLNIPLVSNPETSSPSALTFLRLLPALLGEEMLVLVPVSMVLELSEKQQNKLDKGKLTMLVIVSSLIFGALHLPTYHWNFVQSLIMIGIVRIPFTIAYLKTKSVLPSFLIHYIYDVALIFITLFAHLLS